MGHANLEGKAGCQGQAKAWARVGQDRAAKGVCSAGTLDCGIKSMPKVYGNTGTGVRLS